MNVTSSLPVLERLWRSGRFLLVIGSMIVCGSVALAGDQDSDGDGLSDFHETYKHFTDPTKSDTDGDGRPDGDWLERREYQYTVRSVVQVMKPVTIEFLTDDYQDARLLDETDSYVELEVIHYPFNRVADAIVADDDWRKTVEKLGDQMDHWLEPGPTSNWTPELANRIRADLAEEGIELENLNDQETVEQVSRWLLKRAKYEDGFSTFVTAFDDTGNPYLPEALEDAPDRTRGISVQEQWQREIFASGMYENRIRGSCSSSSIYLSGCLRAIGIPTRTILCIPVIDANDEPEMGMVRRLQQPSVRRSLLAALTPLKNSWASHTYNEVFVGGRWRRLNYDRLGQNTYDPGLFGLMTHVATFHDWADAQMPESIGMRQHRRPDDVFGGPNPYSTISLRDEVGEHCELDLPGASSQDLTVTALHWTDSPELPAQIRDNCRERGRFGLIADITGFHNRAEVAGLLSDADLRVYLMPAESDDTRESPPRLGVGFDPGCYWASDSVLRIYVPFGSGDQRDLVKGIRYDFQPRNDSSYVRWVFKDGLSVIRE